MPVIGRVIAPSKTSMVAIATPPAGNKKALGSISPTSRQNHKMKKNGNYHA
jgi:hypothetical protein